MRQGTFLFFFLIIILACNNETPSTKILSTDPIGEKFPELDFFQSRNWPDQSFDYQAYLKEVDHVKANVTNRSDGDWITQGPGNVSGRVGTIEIDQNGTIYIGYSKGGVYKSTDDGATYESLMDQEAFLTVSDIEIDPNDAQTIYVGTGDVDISIMFGIGDGVIKSVDGGQTWTNIGLNDQSIISRVHVDKNDSNLVFASSMGIPGEKSNNRGIYKSVDGGSAWEQILFVNDSTGIQDMLVHPENPDIIYATGWNRLRSNRGSVVAGPDARVYKTVDGGMNWEVLTGGLPELDFSRVGLDMSGTDPDIIFVNFATSSQFHSAYKSIDAGETWTIIAERGENGLGNNSHGGFAWFFGQMRVNPQDDDDIFLLGVQLYRTLDGGASWENVNNGMHVDHHELVFDGDRIYVGNDGGAYRSEDLSDAWSDIDDNVTGLLYKVGYNPHQPDFYFGGAQDNSMYFGNEFDINNWTSYSGGDGFQPAFHPSNPNIWYTEFQNGGISARNINTGAQIGLAIDFEGNFYWDTPYFISPHNEDLIFMASDSVFSIEIDTTAFVTTNPRRRSPNLTDPAEDWTAHSISTIDQSPINSDLLYAGTTDGLVWRSLDEGQNWDPVGNGVPRRFVSKIVASPSEANQVYLCLTGYRDNEYIPHVFRSSDNGDTWQDISSDLPQFAVNDIFIDPQENDEHLYVATDGGVYYSVDAGVSWDRLGGNMPMMPIWDLAYNVLRDELVAGSFARGILSFDLEQINDDPLSTQDQEQIDLKLYPNPVSNDLFIDSEYAIKELKLLNQNGKLLRSVSGSSLRQMDVSDLISGSYILHFTTEHGTASQVFIKE